MCVQILILAFLANTIGPIPARADEFILPKAGAMVPLSPAFDPPVLKGIKIHLDNPFHFDFILDKGESLANDEQLKQETQRLIKYFLASLTVPEQDLWVNLSPYEKDRIVPEAFGQTEMGRDLLAQDYLLKQVAASLIYPEDEVGKKFWKRVYEEVSQKFGTTELPLNTFNKVWVMPEKAVVYENAQTGTALVVESKLKVMLDQDYLALKKHTAVSNKPASSNASAADASRITREIVIPALIEEVNSGENFYHLRQIYQSLILAAWYKKKIKDGILEQVYTGKNRIDGISISDPQEKEKIYGRYLQAFKKGVFNFIKEEPNPINSKNIVKKYFSGGVTLMRVSDMAQIVRSTEAPPEMMERIQNIDPATLSVVSTQLRITRRGLLAAGAGAALWPPKEAPAQRFDLDQSRIIEQFFGIFTRAANPDTGLTVSHLGSPNASLSMGTQTYDESLRAIAAIKSGRNTPIIRTYARNISRALSENSPQTIALDFQPSGGVLNRIRIANFSQPNWWNTWEFKVSAGDNAWIGLAALYDVRENRNRDSLRFAQERARFLMALEDTARGGLRFGPAGQHSEPQTPPYWTVKSTEHNESALAFFDMMYAISGDAAYKAIADRIYNWLITEMYDAPNHVFKRGMKEVSGQWIKDDLGYFAPDTTSWAPLNRILNDSRFGANRIARLQEFERIMQETEKRGGVFQGGILKGISYSPFAQSNGIISIEWSSQFAIKYWQISQEYSALNMPQKAREYVDKYNGLMKELEGYFRVSGNYRHAPYAVYSDGRIAANNSTDQGWSTSEAPAAVASAYYAFARAKFDPLTFDRAMLGEELPEGLASVLPGDKTTSAYMTFGSQEIEIRYPSVYKVQDGPSRTLHLNEITAVVSTAAVELQQEFSGNLNLRDIKTIEIVTQQASISNEPGVIYIPIEDIVSTPGVPEYEQQARLFKKGVVKVLLYRAVLENQGLDNASVEKALIEYINGDPSPTLHPPHYVDAPPADYHIVVPVYNEGRNLLRILPEIKRLGYMGKITFVDDASTDNGLTRGILKEWVDAEGMNVVFLEKNMKKEGAIRKVMEDMNKAGKLPEKVILLDSDSFFHPHHTGGNMQEAINQAAAYMDRENIAGLSFRIDPLIDEKSNLLEKVQYAEYSGTRWWNRMTSKKGQLWVINGPGGMFNGKLLLETLRTMVPDFETGDLLITVNLMKNDHRVAYYNDIVVKTIVPSTVKGLFKQRERWERGTTKVLVNERGFYLRQFKERTFLSIMTTVQLLPIVGVLLGLVSFSFDEVEAMKGMLFNFVLWLTFTIGISLNEPDIKDEGERWKVIKWYLLNSFVNMAIVLPARYKGFYGALKHYATRKTDAAMITTQAEAISSSEQNNMGGIDLTSVDTFAIHNDGSDIKFNIDNDMLSQLQNITGFVPNIVQIQPMADLRLFLGVDGIK